MKHLNLLKPVASPQWGTKTVNLIPLVNCLIRAITDYDCPVYGTAAKSSLKKLDVVYNAILRFATGLPK